MPRFRESKRPADISASTPTPPAGLVRDLTSRRDSRVLAISSTAIALSIGSPLHDTSDTSGDGVAVRGRGTGWQAAYGAARMAIEITKESSDLFPPLKAVAGALSVLIKNYDVSMFVCELKTSSSFTCFSFQQTSDNVEMMKEIEQRVRSLFSMFASPVSEDDHAEKQRRGELWRRVLSRTDIY